MASDLTDKTYAEIVHKLYYWSHGAKVPEHQELNMKMVKPRRAVIRTDFDLQMYICVNSEGVVSEMSDALLARVKHYGYELQLGISSIPTMPWLFDAKVLMDMITETAKTGQSTSAVLKSPGSERWYIAVAQTMPKVQHDNRSNMYIISWVDIEAYSRLLHDSGFFKSHKQELERLKLV